MRLPAASELCRKRCEWLRVASFHDVAVVSQAIEQRRSQLGVAEHLGPSTEVRVRRDHDAGVFAELAEQVNQ
jgi:hypothetical protein